MKKNATKHNAGFTLIELLIAATIIGTLAIFATVSYRDGVGEGRNTQAKAMLETLAGARQRAAIDYPGMTFSTAAMGNTSSKTCTMGVGKTNVDPSQLISCGYVENLTWTGDNYLYYICDNSSGACKTGALACMRGTGKALSKYQSGSYYYCVFEGSGPQEYL